MPQSVPAQEPRPVVSPRGGPAQSEVVVSLAGLEPMQSVSIGFGSLSQYQNVRRAEADAEGRMDVSVRIPEWAELDRPHYFVVNLGNRRRVPSLPFHVTDAEGVARIEGIVAQSEGTTCLALEGRERTLYTLQGNTANWSPGLRVVVVGTIADAPACVGDGLPISVREIQPG